MVGYTSLGVDACIFVHAAFNDPNFVTLGGPIGGHRDPSGVLRHVYNFVFSSVVVEAA